MIDIPDSIFPTNAEGKSVCFKCQKPLDVCRCPGYDPSKPKVDKDILVVRLDKSGRRGKAVTLIEGLPKDKEYLSALAKKLKSKVGCGGTFYFTEKCGVIEIQGDKQEIIKQVLHVDSVS